MEFQVGEYKVSKYFIEKFIVLFRVKIIKIFFESVYF